MFIYLCIGFILALLFFLLAGYKEEETKPTFRYWILTIIGWPIVIIIIIMSVFNQGEKK